MTRDRRGRSSRTDDDRRRRPAGGFRTRDALRFAELAADALEELPTELVEAAGGVEFDIADVPAGDAKGLALVARAELDGDTGWRVVLHRRALELRAAGRHDLTDLIAEAAGQALAEALGMGWDDYDEG